MFLVRFPYSLVGRVFCNRSAPYIHDAYLFRLPIYFVYSCCMHNKCGGSTKIECSIVRRQFVWKIKVEARIKELTNTRLHKENAHLLSSFRVLFAPIEEASGVNGFTFAVTCRDRGPVRGSLSNPRPLRKPRRNLDTGLLKSIVRFTADERSRRLFGVCGESNRRSAPSEGGDRGGVVGMSLLTGDSSDIKSLKGLENPGSQPSSANSGDIGSTRLSFSLLLNVEDVSMPRSVSSSKTNGSFPNRDFMKAMEQSSCRKV